MKRSFIFFCMYLLIGLVTSCGYLPKKDEPPPLPPIEEPKPPLKMKTDYFRAFPWDELPKPNKDGNDPNTKLHTWREGDTFESVAETEMGDVALGPKLAAYNDLIDPSKMVAGDKVVIPNPIIGLSSQMVVKRKGEKEFGSPAPLDIELKKGDEYKFRFEPNVNGFLYVFREGSKGLEILYPAPEKKAKRGTKRDTLIVADSGKVSAHTPLLIPSIMKGIPFDPKKMGERVFVFLSMRPIQELDDLRTKAKARVEEVEDVLHRVKQSDIVSEGPIKALRIADPADILGFTFNTNG